MSNTFLFLLIVFFLLFSLAIFWLVDFYNGDRKDFSVAWLIFLSSLILLYFPKLVRYQLRAKYNSVHEKLQRLTSDLQEEKKRVFIWRSFSENDLLKIVILLFLISFFLVSLFLVNRKIDRLSNEIVN